jgi:hypothetical protein
LPSGHAAQQKTTVRDRTEQLTPALCQRHRQLLTESVIDAADLAEASCAIMRMPASHSRQWLNAAFLILKI